MAIESISQEEFDSYEFSRVGLFATEQNWYADKEMNVIATLLLDEFDKDWSIVVLGEDSDDVFRPVFVDVSNPTRGAAYEKLEAAVDAIRKTGMAKEKLYTSSASDESGIDAFKIVIPDLTEELKKYLNKHPEKIYDLSPRKFEELIADIIKDFGFDVELTQATRDGGRDIIAHIRTELTNILSYIECKLFAPDHKVGVGIIRQVAGVHHIKNPHKSIIVTTSFFTKDAIEEARKIAHNLDLKDFLDIKSWLSKY